MKYLILLITIFGISAALTQPNYQVDNGSPGGSYINSGQIDWEETSLLLPPGPGKLDSAYIYLSGNTPATDTIYFVGDPAEGSYPPSMWCRYINTYVAFIVQYSGTPGWYAFDLSEANIHVGGMNRIGAQHNINPSGPYFVVDDNQQTPIGGYYNSFINNVYTPNAQFSNIRGVMAQPVQGDYMVRYKIDYDYPDGNGGSLPAPDPTLVDVTNDAGLADIKADMVSVVDWNNDGFDDFSVGNRLYQNNGDGTFTQIDSPAGNNPFALIWADADNDGNIDFFAARGGANDQIYWGNGDGTFTESTSQVIKNDAPTVTPLWFDYDKDGLLDLYIANGRRTINNQEVYYLDKLYRNLGNREFEDVTASSGIQSAEENASPLYPALDTWGASVTDYNNDGYPDIFVATYRLAPDLLLRNNGDGTFTNVAAETGALGVPTYYENYFGHGMGSDWGDFDNDGDLDLAVGNLAHFDDRALASNKSLILRNESNGESFQDITEDVNLRFFEMNAGIMWIDINNDGLLDLVHSQYSYDNFSASVVKRYSRFYINQGAEENFYMKDMTWEFGSLIHGAWTSSRIDFDNDGAFDILMASAKENVKLYKNDVASESNSVTILPKVIFEGKERVAYGTSMKLTKLDGSVLLRALPGTVSTGRASKSTDALHFGLGEDESFLSLEVEFPDGESEIYSSEELGDYLNKRIEVKKEFIFSSVADAAGENIKISPNPFSESAEITFFLNKPERITVNIYNTKGNLISTIAEQYYGDGQHRVIYKSDGLDSGVYIIKIEGNKTNITSKAIHIK